MTDTEILTQRHAREFATDPGSVQLSLFARVDPLAAKIIAEAQCEWLCLDGMIELNEETAMELIAFSGRGLSLNGLRGITNTVAEALGSYTGELQLNGIAQISNQVAQALGRQRGVLYLTGLKTFSNGAAQSLVGHPDLCLSVKFHGNGKLPVEAGLLFKRAAKENGRAYKISEGFLWYAPKGPPPPMPRRAYGITLNKPSNWVLTSAIFNALVGRSSQEEVRGGWFLEMQVEEIEGFTVLLEDSLTLPEQAVVVASGQWPILRIPDGLLVIGLWPSSRETSLEISEENHFQVRAKCHTKYAIVRVPPGCYSVGIHQHCDSYYTFELRKLDIPCHWDRQVESQRSPAVAAPICSDYLPLVTREDLSSDLAMIQPAEANVGSLAGLRNRRETWLPVRFPGKIRKRFPCAPFFDDWLTRGDCTAILP